MQNRKPLKEKQLDVNTRLTGRERDVLYATCLGYTSRDIAEYHNISHYTVEMHRKNLMQKLNARNTANLIYKAGRLGIIKELNL